MFLSGGTELSQAVPRSVYGLALIWTHIALHSKFSMGVHDVLVISLYIYGADKWTYKYQG